MNELSNEPTVNFELPRLYPVMAKLDLEAYRAWAEQYGLECELHSEVVAITEYHEVYKAGRYPIHPEAGIYGRTWISTTHEGAFGGDYKSHTSCDIPERFLSVTV